MRTSEVNMLSYQISALLNLKKYYPYCTQHQATTSTYFDYIIEKYETLTDNPLVRIHVNKIEAELF